MAQSPPRGAGPISWQSAGDSYSAGQGLRDREGVCARSQQAYGPKAAQLLRGRGWDIASETFTACSGAVTEQYSNRWTVDWGPSAPLTIATCGNLLLVLACGLALPRGTHTFESEWKQGRSQGGPAEVDVLVMTAVSTKCVDQTYSVRSESATINQTAGIRYQPRQPTSTEPSLWRW